MKHPKHERCLELSSMFFKFSEANPKFKLHMTEAFFSPCNSYLCHAGAFAVMRGKQRTKLYDFESSADEMSRFLFEDNSMMMADLRIWARKNYKIWGNSRGNKMFLSSRAFSKYEEVSYSLTIKDIANWWLGVHDRLVIESVGV